MKLDATRYNAWYNNPERYRLEWVQNIRLKEPQEGLSIGTAFHLMVEGSLLGWTPEELLKRLGEEEISPTFINEARALYNAYVSYGPNLEMIASEMEFEYPIPGSPHSMVGKIDQIVKYGGRLWVHDFKTAKKGMKFGWKENEWKAEIAPSFYILGARHLGYDVVGELIQYISRDEPVKVHPLIETERSEQELNLSTLAVHQTCEQIEMMLNTFGPDLPWPHLKTIFCAGKDKCPFGRICGVSKPRDILHFNEFFSDRKEHLKIIGDNNA